MFLFPKDLDLQNLWNVNDKVFRTPHTKSWNEIDYVYNLILYIVLFVAYSLRGLLFLEFLQMDVGVSDRKEFF